MNVVSQEYGRPLSSIFGPTPSLKGRIFEYEDDDPEVEHLRYIDYRYIRFYYHQLFDKFSLNNHWRDPNWESAKTLRSGLNGDVKTSRGTLFGQNAIDIEEKSVLQLLVDEVRFILNMCTSPHGSSPMYSRLFIRSTSSKLPVYSCGQLTSTITMLPASSLYRFSALLQH